MTMRGVVLTHTSNLTGLLDTIHANQLGVLKVVTGWGLNRAWTDPDRRLAARAPMLIVRTVAGDGKTLDPNKAVAELQPWYTIRPDLVVEIGNEPNAPGAGVATDKEIWEYRYNLLAAIRRIRVEMPRARIIGPAMVADASLHRWLAILGDTTPLVDYIGLHAYEWYQFTPPGTQQLETALHAAQQLCRMHGHRPLFFTELGINDIHQTPTVLKLQRYRALSSTLPGNVAGACYYHICERPINDDQRAYAFTTPSLVALR